MHIQEEEERDFDFQIAPMVDVIFMLVIFFMLSAAVKQTEFGLGMTMPGEGTPSSEATPLTPIEVEIREDGTVLFNQLAVGQPDDKMLEDLTERLKKAVELFGDKQPVIIQPRPFVLHQRVIDVMNACAAANVKALSFAG